MVTISGDMQKINDQQAVGFILQELREDRGLSQRELGKKLGVSYSTVSRLESGTRKLNEDIVDGLTVHLGIDKYEAIQLYLLSSAPLELKDDLIDAIECWRRYGR